jgi:multiple sugar transport system ATP-binding protein
VASFIGSPSMNFLRGRVAAGGFELEHGGTTTMLPLPPALAAITPGAKVILGIRPEHITDAESARAGATAAGYHPTELNCTVEMTEPTGPDTLVFAVVNGVRITCRTHPRAGAMAGKPLALAFDLSKAVLFDPATEQRLY